MWEYKYSDELYHWGIKGMKWGVRRYQNEDGTLTNAGKKRYAQYGNSYAKKNNGTILGRKTYEFDDPVARKKRIDADIKEADDRVKFYGSKRAAKSVINDEADYAKQLNNGKAFANTLLYGGGGGLGAWLGVGLATASDAAAIASGGGVLLGVGLVSAAAAKKANDFIKRHANDQIMYTEESEYGHDMVVAIKKHDD